VAAGLRIGIVGATGALGGEVLAALDASRLRVAEIVALASDRSLGSDVEFQGELYPVLTQLASLRGLDLLFCCAPAEVSLGFVRLALHAQVPCIDCSGAMLASQEVPLCVAALNQASEAQGAPVVATPASAALPWSLVLAPLHRAAGLRRVVGSVLEAASRGGRDAIEALSSESLALFNQQFDSDAESSRRPAAFDCLPSVGAVEGDGSSPYERAIATGLGRLLGSPIGVAVTAIQVPAFVGQASLLALETEQPLEPKQAEDLLRVAPRVELWAGEPEGPSLRAAAGRDVVLVGRVRRDPSVQHGLLLWVVTDLLRLAAGNAVEIAAARLQLH
jgi:aspartate-semialdehyde dehydrogenase